MPHIKAKMLFDLYAKHDHVCYKEFLQLFDNLCLISINFVTSMILSRGMKKLNEYTERLLLSKELAKTRVFSEWFINGESLSCDLFSERMVRYGFISAIGVRCYVYSSFSSLAYAHHGTTRAVKTLVDDRG